MAIQYVIAIFFKLTKNALILHYNNFPNIVQTLMKLKVFYKGYFRQNKGCFIKILTKIKSKLTSNFLVYLSDPNL